VTPRAPRSWPKHLFRIATLVVPSALAWCTAFWDAHPRDLTDAVTYALGPLWVLLAGGLLLRTIGAVSRRAKRGDPSIPVLAQIDVLTSAGTALAWLSAFAIMTAVWLGWASLAAVGLLGTGLFHVVVLLGFVALRGGDPMRVASISRRFVPEQATEGDTLIEELSFAGTRIPIGFRLFAEGRIGPRWATSRHVLDGEGAGAEVVLESEVGPAVRGEHDAEPLTVWLQDTFGICRSMRTHVGEAHVTVLPRLREAEKLASALDRGDGPRAPRAASRLPTEGCFRLREYQQGDDVRRIHWVRSLAARELIVRLPDELPPDRPHGRLVLDTFFPEAFALSCDAPSELLDSMVGVWLAVGRMLVDSGARVSLVTSVPHGAGVEKRRHELSLRTMGPALRLGAQISWQNRMVVDELMTDEATLVVSRTMLARPQTANARWIAVLPAGAPTETPWQYASDARMPFPMGSSDNRWSRRRREAVRMARLRGENARALVVMHGAPRALPGSFLARAGLNGTIRLEALR
jgi:uncharacterized protein (DUF58 family)